MRLTQENVECILRLHDKGISQREIAKIVKRSRGTIAKVILYPNHVQERKRYSIPHLVEIPKCKCKSHAA